MLKNKLKSKKGYSVGELLITVAIIVILLAIGVGSLVTIQRNLRQTELDAKAETIYTAVTNRMAMFYAAGLEDVYQPENSDAKALKAIPGDASEEDGLTNKSLYYFTSTSSLASKLVNEDVLSSDLLNGHWVVEYNPESGAVWGVYYSEEKIDVSTSYSPSNPYLDDYRVKENRISAGARVGYYGGPGTATSSDTKVLTPKLTIDNGEKLTATIKCTKPLSISDKDIVFEVTFEDDQGNKYIKYYSDTYSDITSYPKKYNQNYDWQAITDVGTHVGRSYTINITLDDLSSESTRFYQTFGDESGHNEKAVYNNKGNLVAGTELKISVNVTCPSDYTVDQSGSSSSTTNSLFADDSSDDTAVLTKGRHLQNLDESSHVSENVTKAQQMSDITFNDDSEAEDDWYSVYKTNYFNGYVGNEPNFKAIKNNNLTTMNGSYTDKENETEQYRITQLITNSSEDAGLFKNVEKQLTVNDVYLSGTKVTSSTNAGGLVGSISSGGKVTINNSQVFLSRANGDLKNNESVRWITGTTASGGLVGSNAGTLTITSSSASSVLGNSTSGGLIGNNTGTANLTKAYADSYIFGSRTGGLIGFSSGTVSLESCYAAGFIGLNSTSSSGAGLVNGSVRKAMNSYTIVSCYAQKKNRIDLSGGKINATNKGTYYSTARDISTISKVYYFSAGTHTVSGTSSIGSMSSSQLQKQLGNDFTTTTAGYTSPYNLMGQSLTTYPYPRLSNLDHYGDWEAEFISGSLVYYEKYANGVVGFYGANVESTLINSSMIVGDGYGVVFRDDGNIPTSFTVTVDGTKYTLQSTSTYYLVNASSGVTYRVYPLPKEAVNPTSTGNSFYKRVVIEQNGETSSYDFNPHFAKTVISVDNDAAITSLKRNDVISIRSPRHLYDLSLYYDSGYRTLTDSSKAIFTQERNISYSSYDWNTFYKDNAGTISQQEPIGQTQSSSFNNVYDGGCYTISDVSFVTQSGNYIGMFGYNTGTLRNIVITTDKTSQYYVQRKDTISSNNTVYFGVLAGYNTSTISNCAVSGYYLSGEDGTIYGYENSTVYIGNMVGGNTGTIINSSADCPQLRLSMLYAHCYAGGFVGTNTGTIRNSYALGNIKVADSQNSTTIIAGFAARNSGIISDSYAATALVAAGSTQNVYGFGPVGGSITNCYYLSTGTYEYVNELNSYNYPAGGAGTGLSYENLKKLNSSKTTSSQAHPNTDETYYPFRPVVTDQNGSYIHYGDWVLNPELGSYGVFYWEYEDGQNAGYKFTYIGFSEGTSLAGTTLCNAHDDSGKVTEYGYGYFAISGEENVTVVSTTDIAYSGSTVNAAAKASLEKQMPGFTFYPYTTTTDTSSDYIYLSGTEKNGTMTLSYKDNATTFTISPFFANAMSVTNGPVINSVDYSKEPGTSSNQYEIRNDDQLQYLNWNSQTKSVDSWLNYADYKNNKNSAPASWSNFTYLGYVTGNSKSGSQNKIYCLQTHDVDANMTSNGSEHFYPIGSMCETTTDASGAAALYANYFNGTYDGQSYVIKNLEIASQSQAVGLFGITISADIQNLILYSENGNTIQTLPVEKTEGGYRNWYVLGGVVGEAMLGNDSTGKSATFKNCTVSGYTIKDGRNDPGYGGSNIGGFVGLTNVAMTNCSAVNTMDIAITYKNADRNVRVGGLVGTFRGSVLENCYSGGSINCSVNNSTNIHVGGLVGGYFTRDNGNMSSSDGIFGTLTTAPTIQNCYTYEDLSGLTGSSVKTICPIVSNGYNEGPNSNKVVVSNCYYYNQPSIKYKQRTVDNGSTKAIAVSYEQMAYNELICEGYFTDVNGKVLDAKDIQDTSNTGKMYEGKKETTYQAVRTKYLINNKSFVDCLNNDGSSWKEEDMKKGNGSWNVVTSIDDSGKAIDGKFSFPGSELALQGKNYPFPTILNQTDLTFGNTVNVHYGQWPLHGIYWSEGRASVDIFDALYQQDKITDYVYREVTLMASDGYSISSNISKENFTYSMDGIVEFDSFEQDGDNFKIKFKVLKDGSTNITYTDSVSQYMASFNMEVTANLNVSANPSSLIMRYGEDQNVTFKAYCDSDTTEKGWFTDKVIWYAVASEEDKLEITGDGSQRNVATYGYQTSMKVTASYTYNGNDYIQDTYVDITPLPVVGLSDNSQYVEVDTSTEQTTGTSYDYSSITEKPTYTDSKLFLYEALETDVLNTYDIKTIEVSDGTNTYTVYENGTVDYSHYYVTFDDFETKGIYNYRNGTIYKTDTTASSNVSVKVVLTNGNTTYTLTINESNVEYRALYEVTLKEDASTTTEYVLENDSYKLPTISEKEGYTGLYWTSQDTQYFAGSVITITSNQTFTAVYQANDYLVTFDTNGGQVSPESMTVTYDQAYGNLPEPTKNGSTFAGWYLDEELIEPVTSSTIVKTASDHTLYAKWNLVTYTITYHANGGVAPSEPTIYTIESQRIELSPATNKKGYSFDGWYTKETLEDDSRMDIIPTGSYGNLDLYAKWKANSYEVQFNANGGEVETTSKSVTYDSTYGSLPTPTRVGYTFTGWYTAATGGSEVTSQTKVQITDTQTLYAHWSAITYTVTFDANGGSVTQYAKDVVYDSKYGTLPTPTRYACIFEGWYTYKDSGVKITADTVVQITGDTTLYAHWTECNIVTLVGNGTSQEIVVTPGATSTSWTISTTKTGYTFDGWYTTDDSSGTQVIDPSGNITGTLEKTMTLYARWHKEKDVFEKTTSLGAGTYVIEKDGYLLTYTLNRNNSRTISKVEATKDGDYIEYPTDTNAIFVTTDGSKLNPINETRYYLRMSYLRLSISNVQDKYNEWTYSSKEYLSVPYFLGTTCYLIYNDDEFSASLSPSSINLYKLTTVTDYAYGYEEQTVVTQSASALASASVEEKEYVSTSAVDVYYDSLNNLSNKETDDSLSQKAISIDLDSDQYVVSLTGKERTSYNNIVGSYDSKEKAVEAISKYVSDDSIWSNYDETKNLGKIKAKDESIISWYKNREGQYVVCKSIDDSLSTTRIYDSIYFEKNGEGYDVYVDTSDERISLTRSSDHTSSMSANSYYVGTIQKNGTLILPFKEDVKGYHTEMMLKYDDTMTLILNDTSNVQFIDRIEVESKDTNKIASVHETKVDYQTKRGDSSFTTDAIEDYLSDNVITIQSSHRLLLEVSYKDSNNKTCRKYISSYVTKNGSTYTNKFTLSDDLLNQPFAYQFKEIADKDDIAQLSSNWTKSNEFNIYEDFNITYLTSSTLKYSGGTCLGYPTFNQDIWVSKNPYSSGNMGQCTWFAWARFYEIYGYSPGFTGNGYECVSQLIAAHPDQFVLSSTPVVGSVFSADASHNHVGIVVAVNGDYIMVQEGNLDGANNEWSSAILDWQVHVYTLNGLKGCYGNVTFANPISVPTKAVTSAASATATTGRISGITTSGVANNTQVADTTQSQPTQDTTSQEVQQENVAEQTDQPIDNEEIQDPVDETISEQPSVTTGWIKEDDYWYYVDETGMRYVGEHEIDGILYTFDETGILITNVELVEAAFA